jgi:hypothetical protein
MSAADCRRTEPGGHHSRTLTANQLGLKVEPSKAMIES